ncbi:hypothetical protein T439DRAFT_357605 [Meredithblackwellia eburnea MCA 4105]
MSQPGRVKVFRDPQPVQREHVGALGEPSTASSLSAVEKMVAVTLINDISAHIRMTFLHWVNGKDPFSQDFMPGDYPHNRYASTDTNLRVTSQFLKYRHRAAGLSREETRSCSQLLEEYTHKVLPKLFPSIVGNTWGELYPSPDSISESRAVDEREYCETSQTCMEWRLDNLQPVSYRERLQLNILERGIDDLRVLQEGIYGHFLEEMKNFYIKLDRFLRRGGLLQVRVFPKVVLDQLGEFGIEDIDSVTAQQWIDLAVVLFDAHRSDVVAVVQGLWRTTLSVPPETVEEKQLVYILRLSPSRNVVSEGIYVRSKRSMITEQ